MSGHKNVLVVVGTLAEASRLQAKTLVEAGLVRHLVISPDALFAGPSLTGMATGVASSLPAILPRTKMSC